MACKLRQYLLTKSNLTKAYHKHHAQAKHHAASRNSTKHNSTTNGNTGGSIRTISQLTSNDHHITTDHIGNNSRKYWLLPASLKRRYLRCSTVKLTPPPCENEHVNGLTYEKLADYTLDLLSDIMDDVICQHADQIDTDISLNVSVYLEFYFFHKTLFSLLIESVSLRFVLNLLSLKSFSLDLLFSLLSFACYFHLIITCSFSFSLSLSFILSLFFLSH